MNFQFRKEEKVTSLSAPHFPEALLPVNDLGISWVSYETASGDEAQILKFC